LYISEIINFCWNALFTLYINIYIYIYFFLKKKKKDSVVYVLNEKHLKLPGGPTTVQQSSWIGTSASSICLIYIILYTIPNYQTLIVDKIREKYGDQPYTWIYICYVSKKNKIN